MDPWPPLKIWCQIEYKKSPLAKVQLSTLREWREGICIMWNLLDPWQYCVMGNWRHLHLAGCWLSQGFDGKCSYFLGLLEGVSLCCSWMKPSKKIFITKHHLYALLLCRLLLIFTLWGSAIACRKWMELKLNPHLHLCFRKWQAMLTCPSPAENNPKFSCKYVHGAWYLFDLSLDQ